MRILNRSDVEACLPHADCIEVLADTMRSVSARDVVMPLRKYMEVPDSNGGKMALMPGYLGDPRCFGVKIVSKFPREPGSALGSHVGAVVVFDADTGVALAMLDGGALTAIRTAAASALATRELARQGARHLVVLGTGEQALHHVRALLVVREFSALTIWGRTPERAGALLQTLDLPESIEVAVATEVRAAVEQADVLCAVTSAKDPIFSGEWLADGTHVNLVGAAVRDAKETDVETVRRSRFFVDYRESALDQAGELMDLVDEGNDASDLVAGEIGDVIAGRVAGRESEDQITVYKSLGVSAQDLAAGWAALRNAELRSIGHAVDW